SATPSVSAGTKCAVMAPTPSDRFTYERITGNRGKRRYALENSRTALCLGRREQRIDIQDSDLVIGGACGSAGDVERFEGEHFRNAVDDDAHRAAFDLDDDDAGTRCGLALRQSEPRGQVQYWNRLAAQLDYSFCVSGPGWHDGDSLHSHDLAHPGNLDS